MVEKCNCQNRDESEIKLDNGKAIRVRRLNETFLEFRAMGMPAIPSLGDLLAQRIRPTSALVESELHLYKAALLREYSRFVQAPQAVEAQTPVEAGGATAQVEIFSKPSCPYTRGLKRKLEHDQVSYVEYDVQSDPAMLRLMLKLNGGQRKVPTVRQGDQVTVGFHGT